MACWKIRPPEPLPQPLLSYLRDLGWQHYNRIHITQGEDMGARSVIEAQFTDEPGSSIRVSGATRDMDDPAAKL